MSQEQKAKKYNRKKIFIEITETILLIIFLTFFMAFGWSLSIKNFLSAFTSSFWLLNGLYCLTLLVMITLLSSPFDYYSGFYLEHKYELSTQNFASWIIDQLKGLALTLVFGLIIVEIIYGLMRSFPSFWWLITAGILSGIFIILTKLAPVLLMPIFFKFRPLSDSDLEARILELTKKLNTKISGIFEMDLSKKSKTANAALAGIGKTRRIVLSDTLLNNYDHDEIEVIMAHELGHHIYNHLWKGIFIQSILILALLFIIALTLNSGVTWFHLKGIYDIAGLPYLIFISIIFSFILLPFVNLYLRRLEYQADQFGVSLTGKKEAFIGALEKLSQQNLSEKEPNPIIEFIFHSHPSISKRINRLLNNRLLNNGQNQSTPKG